MKHILVLCAVVVALFPSPAVAGANGLVISQVQVAGAGGADDEFIELHNLTSGPLPLAGWSLQYKSGSGGYPLSAKKNLPDVAVPAGGYYLVANVGYGDGVAADLVHSAFNMSGAAAGATIFLSTSTAAIVSGTDAAIADKLGYGSSAANAPQGTNAILPESGKSLVRVSDTGDNLADFTVSDSVPRNSAYLPPPEEPIEEEPVEEEPADENPPADDPVEEPAEEPPVDGEDEAEDSPDDEPEIPAGDEEDNEQEEQAVTYSDKIQISEFLPNPSGTDAGAEWVELYNSGTAAVSLAGWLLDDDGPVGEIGSSAQVLTQLTISAGQRLTILISAGKFALNNSGSDELRLYWPDENLAAKISYSGTAKENQSWCRLGSTFDWCLPTLGAANAALPQPEDEEDQEEEAVEEEELVDYSGVEIRIVSFLPDPEGTDSGNEKVTIKNIGSASVDLGGWALDDGLGSEELGSSAFILSAQSLGAGQEVELAIPAGKFALNNTTADGIRLFSPAKALEHAVEYPKAKEGLYFTSSGGTWSQVAIDPPPAGEEDDDGQVLAAGLVESTSLPRTGLPIAHLSFATLPAIWYIGGKKGKHEQARSHRCAGRQAGREPGRG